VKDIALICATVKTMMDPTRGELGLLLWAAFAIGVCVGAWIAWKHAREVGRYAGRSEMLAEYSKREIEERWWKRKYETLKAEQERISSRRENKILSFRSRM
jgi:hypothetical protein